jgi:RNA polymerase sigma factor (sigma-70 family)
MAHTSVNADGRLSGQTVVGRARERLNLSFAVTCLGFTAPDDALMSGDDPADRSAKASRSGGLESTFQLIERARAGDQEALDRLFARHLKPLQRWASGRLPKWARELTDTDDLVQDTLLRTFKRIGVFEPRGVGALHAYLRQAVLNRIREELRRKGRRPDATDLDDVEVDSAESPLEHAIGSEAVERYERALGRLKPQEREAIIARVEMGYSFEELAEALGKPTAEAARKAAQRALIRLAEEMQREAE